jgi:DnaK suppressor protein
LARCGTIAGPTRKQYRLPESQAQKTIVSAAIFCYLAEPVKTRLAQRFDIAEGRMKRTMGDEQSVFRTRLLEKRNDALTGMDLKLNTWADLGRIAEDDQAPMHHDEYIALHLSSLDYATLCMVEGALQRLDTGGYGICLNCGGVIPAKRLKAIPWAEYCLACQDLLGTE